MNYYHYIQAALIWLIGIRIGYDFGYTRGTNKAAKVLRGKQKK